MFNNNSLENILSHFHKVRDKLDKFIAMHDTHAENKAKQITDLHEQVDELHYQILEHDAQKVKATKIKENLNKLLEI